MNKLSATQVRSTKSKEKAYKLSDGYGMYLHVSKTGKRTWRYRYRIAGTESTYVLGTYPDMTLSDARNARSDARKLVEKGVNPSYHKAKEKAQEIERRVQDTENSFVRIATEWIEKQRDSWSPGHTRSVMRSLAENVYPYIGSQPINEIRTSELIEMLGNMEERNALELARKVLQRVNSIFMYAQRLERVQNNPAASLKGTLKARKVTSHAALEEADLPQFLKDLSKAKTHISTKRGLQFLILTAARSVEVRGAKWGEIDMKAQMWRIPAERMKMDNPHNVHLTKQSLAILKEMGDKFGKKGYIFPAVQDYGKMMSQNTMLYALHRMGYQGRCTVHGFRATFSTIANEKDFDADVIERALAHTERNKVRAAYHRSEYFEQRRELLQWWADLLQEFEGRD